MKHTVEHLGHRVPRIESTMGMLQIVLGEVTIAWQLSYGLFDSSKKTKKLNQEMAIAKQCFLLDLR